MLLIVGAGGFKLGHDAGYRAGWAEGRAALSAETRKRLDDANAKAAEMEARARACLLDPSCRLSDDGWRIDR